MARKSNINVNFSDFIADHKFINVAKAGSRVLGNNAASDPLWYDDTKLNADHYPLEATNGINFQTFHFATTWVVRWKGSGSVSSVSVANKTNASAGIYTGGGADGSVVTNGRFTCTIGRGYINWVVKGTTISDLVICPLAEEVALDGGQMFRTAYIDLLKSYNGVLRHLLTSNANLSPLCKWADRPLPSMITYNGGRYYPGRKAGAATGTNDYVLASYAGMPATLTHGEIVHFKVNNSNTQAVCTLDAGGRGPKPLVQCFLADPKTTGSNSAERPLAGANHSAVYDATLDKWVMGQKAIADVGHPAEVMIQESNETGCPGWFHIPFWADDDYVTQFATLLCQTYQPSEVFIEYINECWNFAAGFPFTSVSAAYGTAVFGLGSGNGAHYSGWYGYRFRQISTIMRAVFASYGQSSKLKMVLASQGAQGDSSQTITDVIKNTRFQNVAKTELSGANAPILFADVISYGLYYGSNSVTAGASMSTIGSDNNWSRIAHNAATLKSNALDPFFAGSSRAGFEWLRDDIIDAWSKSTGAFQTRVSNWNALAAEFGKEIRLYESNWEMCGPSSAWCSRGVVRLLANSTKTISSNAISTMISSLGLLNSSGVGGTGFPNVGGDTINALGLNGLAVLNKAGNAISASTALSGSAGTDSVVTDFVAGNTITISGTTITFVASGASGNQLNVTDTVGTLLAKIDAITGTSSASFVVAPALDSSYGGQTGKINQFLLAFFVSAQCEQAVRRITKDFYSLSKSSGWSLFALANGMPWSTFAQVSINDATGETSLSPMGNWNALALDNSAKRAIVW